MKNNVLSATDIRQSIPWAKYMESIGWDVANIDGTFVFIKKIKIINRSMIKVQHSKEKINLKILENKVKKYNPVFIIFEPHNFHFDESNYLKNGYRKTKLHFAPSSTIKIDLSKSENEIFNSFSENARRNIRKAEKNRLKIKVVDLKNDQELKYFDIYFNLLKSLTKQKKFYAPGREESFKKMMMFKNNSVLLFAYENDSPVAVVWLGYFDGVITYMQTGIAEVGYKQLANYLLVWEGMKWAKKKKIKIFDFESIYDSRNPRENKRWIGFSEFKKRFHGEKIDYPTPFIKYYSLFFKSLEILSR